ncbi:hypothetical protein ACFQ5D_11290 [Paenibacillus farraposensis]|uniref:Uncharacterized protein n=1 Tax=Paenibacillus farraposensis TaxID=2807095 RepID=A0ABW4DBD4_9BACL|nr:hypothetical protein [Paenibacillus farraposensis]
MSWSESWMGIRTLFMMQGSDSLQLLHFMLQVEDAFCSYIQGISEAEQAPHPEGMETVQRYGFGLGTICLKIH